MEPDLKTALSTLQEQASRNRLGLRIPSILDDLTKRNIDVPATCDRLLELVEEIDDRHPQDEEPWPDPLGEAGFVGPFGRLSKLIDPHTEADPVAILTQGLVAFGSAVGPGPHVRVEADAHRANEFLLLVGKTARGRKGTARGHAMARLRAVDSEWAESCVRTGLASGEGLIHALRDEDSCSPKDKRLLVEEPEFARVLAVGGREGNILTAVLRQAWDGQTLSNLTKNAPLEAKGCHVSVSAHVTEAELLRRMQEVDAQNGYLNRFLFIRVRRSKLLPHGGRLADVDLDEVTTELRAALARARSVGQVLMT